MNHIKRGQREAGAPRGSDFGRSDDAMVLHCWPYPLELNSDSKRIAALHHEMHFDNPHRLPRRRIGIDVS